MDPDESANTGLGPSLAKPARIAGLAYVITISLGVAQSLFVALPLIVPGDATATARNISAHELLFRLGILSDTILYALVLVLSVALYLVLKEVDRSIALTALVLRSAEAVVGLLHTLIGGLLPLLLLEGSADSTPGQLQALSASFLALRTDGLNVILILIGPGGALFCYLFLTSRLVPTALAVWGLVTYVSMFLLGSAGLVLPDVPALITNLLFAQGAVFELLFGLWLLIKAVDTSRFRQVAASRT